MPAVIRCRRPCWSGHFRKCHCCRPIAHRSVLPIEPQIDVLDEWAVGLLPARCMRKHPGKDRREEFGHVKLPIPSGWGCMRTSRRAIQSGGRSAARRAACPSGPVPGSLLARPTSAPREARSDLLSGDLVGRRRPQAPTARLVGQARKEPDLSATLLLKHPIRTHDGVQRPNGASSAISIRTFRADADQAPRSPDEWSIHRATGDTLN